jgi:hypothetical protein
MATPPNPIVSIDEISRGPQLNITLSQLDDQVTPTVVVDGLPRSVAETIPWREVVALGLLLYDRLRGGGGSGGSGGGSGGGITECYTIKTTMPDGGTVTTEVCPGGGGSPA